MPAARERATNKFMVAWWCCTKGWGGRKPIIVWFIGTHVVDRVLFSTGESQPIIFSFQHICWKILSGVQFSSLEQWERLLETGGLRKQNWKKKYQLNSYLDIWFLNLAWELLLTFLPFMVSWIIYTLPAPPPSPRDEVGHIHLKCCFLPKL